MVALVRGLRGLRGHVRVELLTDRPEERFVPGARLHPEGTLETLTVDEASAVADGPGWWLRFRELSDREAVERLRDVYLEVDVGDEPREPGRWLWHELEGLRVRGADGRELGEVVEVYRAGGAEVLLVRGADGELDVPAVRGIVLELAPERGEVVVDLDALDLDARPVEDDDYVRPRDRRPRKQPRVRRGPDTAGSLSPSPSPSSRRDSTSSSASPSPSRRRPGTAPPPDGRDSTPPGG